MGPGDRRPMEQGKRTQAAAEDRMGISQEDRMRVAAGGIESGWRQGIEC
jgi:hypothetical protein